MLEEIKKVVELTLNINLDVNERHRELVDARIIFCLIVLSMTKIKLMDLGAVINRDHSNVVHYKKLSVHLVQYDKNFRQKLENCLQKTGKNKQEIKQILTLDFLKKVTKKEVK